ncbi:MAG: hypothetical protein HC904_03635 [Blastochloris sp.]|nr:hypothetical protein [Blastochloris sp.]
MLLFPLLGLKAKPVEALVLVTDAEGTRMMGERSLQNMEASPASTFKVVLAWAAIESGKFRADSSREVKEAHVPGSPRRITLTQAMFYSSNSYFHQLAPELGWEWITDHAERSGLFSPSLGASWLGKDFRFVEKGGTLRTTPQRNHDFMKRVAAGSLSADAAGEEELRKSLRWPSPRKGLELFGKTGTVTGAVWFNGFGKSSQGTTVVTVFLPGKLEDRRRAIGLFYEVFGLEWNEAWAVEAEKF